MTKNNSVPDGSISAKANNARSKVDTIEPTICTKFRIKVTKPHKSGKLTPNAKQANPKQIPVAKLMTNFTLMNLIKLCSTFENVLTDNFFFLNSVCCIIFSRSTDPANNKTKKKSVIRTMEVVFLTI